MDIRQIARIIMQMNNRHRSAADIVSDIIFQLMQAYLLLVLMAGAFALLIISKLFRNIGGVLITIVIALMIYIHVR
jgi:hypothetical protein